jgi:GAF domain-containing protein
MCRLPILVRCTSSADNFPTTEESPFAPRFRSVEVQEMAYALSVFVAAATNRLSFGSDGESAVNELSAERAALIYDAIAIGQNSSRGSTLHRPDQATLQVAFACLWSHYEKSVAQESVCARVLGFYCLMERTGGRALAPWTYEDPTSAEVAILHPAVVEALAVVPIGDQGRLHEADYLALIVDVAQQRSQGPW